MIKKKSNFKSFLIVVILFQKFILSSWNGTDFLSSKKYLIAIKSENIENQIITNDEEIEINSDEKTKLHEIKRSDCLFCASGYEYDSPYPIAVKGTIVQKRGHKPHEDFWHYGCILQYIEYGNKKCPYCTYELSLNNLDFMINSVRIFIPSAHIFPENNDYQIQEARRFHETRVQFGDFNQFITVRPQNRHSRFSEMLVAIGTKFEVCWDHTCSNMVKFGYATYNCFGKLFDYIDLFFVRLFQLVGCIPYTIGRIIWSIISLIYEEFNYDWFECCKCCVGSFCIFYMIFIIWAIVAGLINKE